MMDFIKTYFDKLLLSALFLTGMGMMLHAIHRSDVVDAATVNWIQNTVGQILAALLTLMVGKSLGQSNATTVEVKTPNPPADGSPAPHVSTQVTT